jgi:KDO2-lipid IV(A) lauroyltransferase
LTDFIKKWLGVALLHVFAVLPYGLKEAVAKVCAWFMWKVNGRFRQVTVRNLEICFPRMSAEERAQLARRSLREMNLGILDSGRTWIWPSERLYKQITCVVGLDDLHAAIANGKGIIVFSPHLGNWELANVCLCKHYAPVTTLYKEPKATGFADYIRQKRQRCGAKLVPAGVSGTRAMLKALKSGGMVSLLPDQVPPIENGKFAPFFGEPTLTMTLATGLLQRTGARAVVACCQRLPEGEFKVVFRACDDAIYDSDSLTALAALNKSVEDCVVDCPEQYHWAYKRFKILPNLQKRDYSGKHQAGSEHLGQRRA